MRLFLAIGAFFRVIGNRDFATRVRAWKAEAAGKKSSAGKGEAQPPGFGAAQAGALQLLRLLQQEGRILDFLEEDLAAYKDEEVGAAARAVHAGCQQALSKVLDKRRILDKEEGATHRVEAGWDARRLRLMGKVSDHYPLEGRVVHPGWLAVAVKLPTGVEREGAVLAPAQIEIA